MVGETIRQVAVLGAGPIGLEAAVLCRMFDLSVTVYEQGEVGEYLRRWGHVRMFTPWGWNVTPWGMQILRTEYPRRRWPLPETVLTGHEYREVYLLPLAESSLVKECLRLGVRVVGVGRSRDRRGWRLLLEDQTGQETSVRADVVLDCTGVYGHPRWLGDGDVPAKGERAARPYIPHGVVDLLGTERERYAGHCVMVVGNGYSAATNIVALAGLAEQHSDTWIYWVSHGGRGQPLPRLQSDPLKERDRLAARANMLATRGDGHVEFHPHIALEGVHHLGPNNGFRVVGYHGDKQLEWEVDCLIASVGYRAQNLLWDSCASDIDDYFVVGAKTDPKSFLLADGHRQLRQVMQKIVGLERLTRLDLTVSKRTG